MFGKQCNYWWVNLRYQNFEDGFIKRGFRDWGFVDRNRKFVSEHVKEGDKFVIYITGVMLFGGILEIISNLNFDNTRPEFPWRFKVRPLVSLPLKDLPPAKVIFSNLRIIDPKNPGGNIQGAIKPLSEEDYKTIYDYLISQPNAMTSEQMTLAQFEEQNNIKKHKMRDILDFLDGRQERNLIRDTKLCEWLEFCYKNERYAEAARIFTFINFNNVADEEVKKIKKIYEVCSLKSNQAD